MNATGRLAAALVLLGTESLLLTLRFDGEALVQSRSALLRAFATAMGTALPFVVAMTAAGVLVGSDRWRHELTALVAAARTHRARVQWLVHVAVFSGLYAASRLVFEGDPSGTGMVWCVAVWLTLAGATLASWLAIVAPWSALRALVWRMGRVLLAGGLVGAAALALGRVSQDMWLPLRHWTLRFVVPLVTVLVPSTTVDQDTWTIGTDAFSVTIGAECSGYEGLGLTAVFLATFFWLFRQRLRFPHVLVVVPFALTAVWGLNVLRIAALIAIGHHFSPSLAAGGFHSYAGLLLFAATSLAIVFGSLRVRFLTRDAPVEQTVAPEQSRENPVAAYLTPFLGLVAAALVSSALAIGGAESWYPLRVLIAALLLWRFRKRIRVALGSAPDATGWLWSASAGLGLATAWVLTAPEGASAASSADAWAPRASAGWWATRSIGAVLIVPLVEELAFRGYLMRRIALADFEAVAWARVPSLALLISSGLFAALHPQHPVGAAMAGLVYGQLARKRQSLLAAALAHAVTNAAILVWAAATGSWHLL